VKASQVLEPGGGYRPATRTSFAGQAVSIIVSHRGGNVATSLGLSPMSSPGSVTNWLDLLKGGEPAAAQQVWELYFERLVGLARRRLAGVPRRAADEQDVAQSAFISFCLGAQAGRFPRLNDRDDLWQLLVVLTARKAMALARRERRQKRGGGKVLVASDLEDPKQSADEPAIALIIGREPTPEFAAQCAEECERLLTSLGNDELRAVAVWKMEGETNEEIARKLGCVLRTIERRLRTIRALWSKELRA
jgi:DNA-directed RNA polymerase specialized sigma24 family protein